MLKCFYFWWFISLLLIYCIFFSVDQLKPHFSHRMVRLNSTHVCYQVHFSIWFSTADRTPLSVDGILSWSPLRCRVKLPWHHLQRHTRWILSLATKQRNVSTSTTTRCSLQRSFAGCRKIWVEWIKNCRSLTWLRMSRVTLVLILSDQSVVCSVLTPLSSIGSARSEPRPRWYQKKVPGTIHYFCKWKTKKGARRVD